MRAKSSAIGSPTLPEADNTSRAFATIPVTAARATSSGVRPCTTASWPSSTRRPSSASTPDSRTPKRAASVVVATPFGPASVTQPTTAAGRSSHGLGSCARVAASRRRRWGGWESSTSPPPSVEVGEILRSTTRSPERRIWGARGARSRARLPARRARRDATAPRGRTPAPPADGARRGPLRARWRPRGAGCPGRLAAAWPPPARRKQLLAAGQVLDASTRKPQRDSLAHRRLRAALAVHLHRAHPNPQVPRQRHELVALAHAPPAGGAGHDGAGARQREDAIDRESERPVRFLLACHAARAREDRLAQRSEACARDGGAGDDRRAGERPSGKHCA